MKLSDYIGNKLKFDENMRLNLQAQIIPREIAIQQVNNLSAAETKDYLAKIDEDSKNQAFGSNVFNETEYFGG